MILFIKPQPCLACGQENEPIALNLEEWTRWYEGYDLSRAAPSLDIDQREILISGTCPKCWEKMFVSQE